MKLTILMLLIAFGIFMLGLKVTGDSPVSRKAPIEKSKETTTEKWLKAKEWSKNSSPNDCAYGASRITHFENKAGGRSSNLI